MLSAWKLGICVPENISRLHPPGTDLTPYENSFPSDKNLYGNNIIVAMHTDDACHNIAGSRYSRDQETTSDDRTKDPIMASFATTWAVFPYSFMFSCEDWQCANLGWLPEVNRLKRFKMMCPRGSQGRMVPYSFQSRKPTSNGQLIQDRLSVTTKGYCLKPGYFKKLQIRGAGDCLEIQYGVLPGEEILVWLEFESDTGAYQDSRHPTRERLDKIFLEIRRKPVDETNTPDSQRYNDPSWTTVEYEHSTMIHHHGPERGMTWEGCAWVFAGAALLTIGAVFLSVAYADVAMSSKIGRDH